QRLRNGRTTGVQVQTGHHILGTTRRQVFTAHTQWAQRTIGLAHITLNFHTRVIDDIALTINAKVPGSGIAALTTMIQHKEAFTIDGKIQAIGGNRNTALTKVLGNSLNSHSTTDLVNGATQKTAGIEIAELNRRLLETCGAGIGNVITGNLEVGGGSP